MTDIPLIPEIILRKILRKPGFFSENQKGFACGKPLSILMVRPAGLEPATY
jgi:hypothetical protein